MIVVVYKYTTDQNLMKQLKDEMQAFQKQMKELREHPDQAMGVQKQAMETNMKYMMQSFKSTMYTLIPILLIFGWLNTHWAFAAIAPGQEFSVELKFDEKALGTITTSAPEGLDVLNDPSRNITDGSAIFTYKGVDGTYIIDYAFNGKPYTARALVTDSKRYENPIQVFKDGPVQSISVGLKKLIVLDLFGWQLGWLGTYIICSIVFSMGLRKLFKVY